MTHLDDAPPWTSRVGVLLRALTKAVSDGELTPKEVAHLDAIRLRHDISFDEFWPLRFDAYNRAFVAVTQDREITETEERNLEVLREYLGLTAAEARQATEKIRAYRTRRSS